MYTYNYLIDGTKINVSMMILILMSLFIRRSNKKKQYNLPIQK